jgi:hypothetical protein
MLLQLKQYNSCTLWLESIRSKNSKNAYCVHVSLFCKFHKVNPDQLLKLNNSEGQLKTLILNYVTKGVNLVWLMFEKLLFLSDLI